MVFKPKFLDYIMKKRVYFMIDEALSTRNKIVNGWKSPTNLYGAIELEKGRKAKIINANLKEIFKIRRGSVVVVNRLKYVPLLKLTEKKVVLINMNSNHDLTIKTNKIKEHFVYLLNKLLYRLCDLIVCLSKFQEPTLRKIKVKKVVSISLGVDENITNSLKKSRKYYLCIGKDKGRDIEFVSRAMKDFPHRVIDGNDLTYLGYLSLIANCKALFLNIDTNRKGSSDLSGTTTCFEALSLEKPILINYQPWLKELFKDNYYVYGNEEELKGLLKQNIKFKKSKNNDHLKLRTFSNLLLKNIENI